MRVCGVSISQQRTLKSLTHHLHGVLLVTAAGNRSCVGISEAPLLPRQVRNGPVAGVDE
jgi:hypothetical protein